MNESDVLIELAGVCRRSPSAALWALGNLCVGQDQRVLEEILEGALEVERVWATRSTSHLRAYQERWGVLPG